MGLFVPSKRPTHRRFSYEPRHYDPSREEGIRRRIRIMTRHRRRNSSNFAFLVILLALALFTYLKLT